MPNHLPARSLSGRVFSLIAALTLVACGCGPAARYKAVALAPATGQVLHNGQPAAGALVRLHPADASSRLTPAARTDADGAFQLTTYENADGAPPGEYIVTIRWDQPTGENGEMADRLKGRYARVEKSPWKIRIQDGPNELEPFVVK